MHRYKFTADSVKKAKYFLQGKTNTGPVWAVKFKADLKIKDGNVFYKDKQIVPKESVGDLLRKDIYKVGGDTPSGRDSAFHILKQRYIGVSRRVLMEWLRAQKALGETRSAVAKPRQSFGERLKRYTFETDLIFLKKNDLVNNNKRFARDDKIPELSYIVSSVEKITGLCRLTPVKSKLPSIVTPICIRHFKEMAKELKANLKTECDVQNDAGKEFNMVEFRKHVRSAKNVKVAPHVENVNRTCQAMFFKIIKQRKAVSINGALQQTQTLKNQTFNRIHKLTPNEIVKRGDTELNLKEYNSSRKEYISGDKRKPFVAGDYVRIQIKKEKGGSLNFKGYKNMTFTERVFIIKKVTKKAVPPKYYVNGKWYLQSSLLKSAPRDEKSITLVESRNMSQQEEDRKERAEHIEGRMADLVKDYTPKPKAPKKKTDDIEDEKLAEVPVPKKRVSKRAYAKAARFQMIINKKAEDKLDDAIENIEHEEKSVHKKHLSVSEKAEKVAFIKKQEAKKKKVEGVEPMPKWKKKILKKYLKKHGLPRGGSSQDLLLRVQLHQKQAKKGKIKKV